MEEEGSDALEVAAQKAEEGKAKAEAEAGKVVVILGLRKIWCGYNMAVKVGEVDLDLREVRFFGFQESVNPFVLAAMYKLLDRGLEPPRVDVVKTRGIYRILYSYGLDVSVVGENCGGHHRAVARFNWRRGLTSLPCNLYDEHRVNSKKYGIKWINLRNIQHSFSELDKRFFGVVKYLPDDGLEELCDDIGISMERMKGECLHYMKKSLDELRSEVR